MSAPGPGRDPAPVLSVVKGDPTEEELAAVLVVLSRRGHPRESTPQASPSGWAAYARSVRSPLHPGPGVWQMSARTS